LLYGRLDKIKIAQFFNKILKYPPSLGKKGGLNGDEFFLCGPVEMIEAARDILIQNDVNEDNIHFELFNAPKQKVQNGSFNQNAVNSRATIKMDGLTFDVPIEKGQNILNAAQLSGADTPFACKGGVCCTCRAKLVEGAVDMLANYALTKQEVEQGFILTCQAVPRTDRVVVDFDVK
jgi:ring-1,2-phenylacetyl-CoA epoxidase subunit PaaE